MVKGGVAWAPNFMRNEIITFGSLSVRIEKIYTPNGYFVGRFAKPRRRSVIVHFCDGDGGTTTGALLHLGVKPAQQTTAYMAGRWTGRAYLARIRQLTS